MHAGDCRGRSFLLTLLLLVAFRAHAGPETYLSVDVGWGECTRSGAWTPLYVSVSHPKPRNATLEYVGPYDSSSSMHIGQSIALSPQQQTYALLVPLINSWSQEPTLVRVRDASTGKILAEEAIIDRAGDDQPRHPQLQTMNMGPFIGTSGRSRCLAELQTGTNGPTIGYLSPFRLPRVAEGYSALQVLVLNQPDISQLEPTQQNAIADWVRGGGHLLLWLSETPIPAGGPLVSLLPCAVGDLIAAEIPPADLKAAGLNDRFRTFKARQLTPNVGAIVLPALGIGKNTGAFAVRQRRGAGHVTMISFDASGLLFDSSSASQRFWSILLDSKSRPGDDRSNVEFLEKKSSSGDYNQSQNPSQALAAGQVMDLLGDVPGVGAFGFGYVAMVLIAIAIIVGPVDWFVLKKLNRQPWTWITTGAWIGLITLGAISIGSFVRSGDLHLRTLRVIEQADGQVFARQDVVGIYSPRTSDYNLEVAPASWWRPLSSDTYAYGRAVSRPIEFHQDDKGSVPLPMTINVWNLRFLQGESHQRSKAVIDAKLTWRSKATRIRPNVERSTPTLTGTITNVSGAVWSNLWLRTSFGVYQLAPGTNLAPGASAPVDLALENNLEWSQQQGPTRNSRYGQQRTIIAESPISLVKAAVQLDARRDEAIEGLLAGSWSTSDAAGESIALVYALSEQAPAAATLADQHPIEKHWQVIRAIVPVKRAPANEDDAKR